MAAVVTDPAVVELHRRLEQYRAVQAYAEWLWLRLASEADRQFWPGARERAPRDHQMRISR